MKNCSDSLLLLQRTENAAEGRIIPQTLDSDLATDSDFRLSFIQTQCKSLTNSDGVSWWLVL